MIEASGVLLGQISKAGAAIRSIWVEEWTEERPGGACCCAWLRSITHKQPQAAARSGGGSEGEFSVQLSCSTQALQLSAAEIPT